MNRSLSPPVGASARSPVQRGYRPVGGFGGATRGGASRPVGRGGGVSYSHPEEPQGSALHVSPPLFLRPFAINTEAGLG